MSAKLNDVFADTSFWIALVVKQDQYHDRAQAWSQQVAGRIFTSNAVLLETANSLARPAWRPHVIALMEHLRHRCDVVVEELTRDLWLGGWELYRNRPDKSWSLTDCISFKVMTGSGFLDALSADEHFRQAGFRPVLLEEP